MRAGALSLSIAMIAAATAAVFRLRPFELVFHTWQFALVVALAGTLLLGLGVFGVRALGEERPAALGALGGALICAATVSAAFAVGPPHVLSGAPGQATPLDEHASVLVRFPPVDAAQLGAGNSPDRITIVSDGRARDARAGETATIGRYVLRVVMAPIALVRAATLRGQPVTVTQREGANFASPYLLFPAQSGDQRLDLFEVPPLHRSVNVTYYPSYRDEARHIYIASPFVLVQVAEENGAPIFRGATISGRPLRGGGVMLTFLLGSYPQVALASAPAVAPFAVGVLMLTAGLAGYLWAVLRAANQPSARKASHQRARAS